MWSKSVDLLRSLVSLNNSILVEQRLATKKHEVFDIFLAIDACCTLFFQMSENDDASTSFESHDRETHNEKIRKKM